jgi:hypothetical protein
MVKHDGSILSVPNYEACFKKEPCHFHQTPWWYVLLSIFHQYKVKGLTYSLTHSGREKPTGWANKKDGPNIRDESVKYEYVLHPARSRPGKRLSTGLANKKDGPSIRDELVKYE